MFWAWVSYVLRCPGKKRILNTAALSLITWKEDKLRFFNMRRSKKCKDEILPLRMHLHNYKPSGSSLDLSYVHVNMCSFFQTFLSIIRHHTVYNMCSINIKINLYT
jgi:hypothetical protein